MQNSEPSEKPAPSDKPSLTGRMVTGTIWMIAMRWTIRFLGIISVSVLARLLDKEDFGIVAMATAVSALPMVFLDLGLEMAVIREKEPGPRFYNTAWTIRALQMTFIALLILASAPLVADFYGDARIQEIFYALSITIFLQGVQNIWIVSFRKNFEFGKDFLFNSSVKLAGVVVTIIIAVILRSYWALVFGQIAGASLRALLSYLAVREKPRWDLSEWRTIWSFSQWNLLRGLAFYVVENSDRLILGKLASAPMVGAFTVGREIAELPTGEIAAPVNRVIGPGFSELQHDSQRLAGAVKKSLVAINTIAVPVSIGIAATAGQIVPILLGKGWDAAIPVIQLVALAGIFAAPQNIIGTIQTVTGHVATATANMWLRAAIILGMGIPASMYWEALGMAASLLIASMLGLAFLVVAICRQVPELSLGTTLATAGRPLMAGLIMAGAVLAWDYSGLNNVIFLLAAKITSGAIVYTALVLVFWRLAGRPDGLENLVLDGMRKGFGHVKSLKGRIFARPSKAR